MTIEDNVVVVPARQENFENMFLKGYWSCVEISEERLPHLKYIACYQTAPDSAVTYYTRIESIKPNPKQPHKYDIYFAEPAKPVGPIVKSRRQFGQGRRYTTLPRLLRSKTLEDLFDFGE